MLKRRTGKPIQEFCLQGRWPSNLGRSLLEGNKDHLHTQARSELMKQEHQVESLNNFISELQQQAYAQRLELQDAQHGYVESRREQVRLQEGSSLKEKVLRDTQTRCTKWTNEESSRTSCGRSCFGHRATLLMLWILCTGCIDRQRDLRDYCG